MQWRQGITVVLSETQRTVYAEGRRVKPKICKLKDESILYLTFTIEILAYKREVIMSSKQCADWC